MPLARFRLSYSSKLLLGDGIACKPSFWSIVLHVIACSKVLCLGWIFPHRTGVLMLGYLMLLYPCFMPIELTHIGMLQADLFNESVAEISAFAPASQRLFFTNSGGDTIDFLNLPAPSNLNFLFTYFGGPQPFV